MNYFQKLLCRLNREKTFVFTSNYYDYLPGQIVFNDFDGQNNLLLVTRVVEHRSGFWQVWGKEMYYPPELTPVIRPPQAFWKEKKGKIAYSGTDTDRDTHSLLHHSQ
jgi:hypothetical protein